MSTVTERVADGAAFLDEHQAGWDRDIDLVALDIGSSCECILGQIHGDFGKGLRRLSLLE